MITDDAQLDGLLDLAYCSAQLAKCPHCNQGFYPMAGSGYYDCPECGAAVIVVWKDNVMTVRKTDFDAYASDEQKAFINRNPHLIPVFHVGGRHFIVRDTDVDETGRHFGPYVLKPDCRLIDLNYYVEMGGIL